MMDDDDIEPGVVPDPCATKALTDRLYPAGRQLLEVRRHG